MTAITDVGFLGLGQMGSAIAERLLNQPFRLHVYDPAPAAVQRFSDTGAVVHDSPRSVSNAAPLVFACLPSQAVSLEVALGPQGVALGDAVKVYADMSTIGREVIERIAEGLASRGITGLDAPVTGGPAAARAGRLALLVSGDPAGVATARPVLQLMGRVVHELGDRPGMAQIMKVVNNVLLGAHMVVASEALGVGERAGLNPVQMLKVLSTGTGQSFACCEILSRGVEGHYDFGAALNVLVKDMALGLQEAQALDLEVPVIRRARATWDAAKAAGWGEQDFTTILPFVCGKELS